MTPDPAQAPETQGGVREAVEDALCPPACREGTATYIVGVGTTWGPRRACARHAAEARRLAAVIERDYLPARLAEVERRGGERALREAQRRVEELCNAATTSANEFGSRTFVLDIDEFRAALRVDRLAATEGER